MAAQPEMWRQPFVGVADEFLIVGAGHRYVGIVVPRDEASVANSPEQGSSFEVVAQPVASDGSVGLLEDFKHPHLHLSYVVAHR